MNISRSRSILMCSILPFRKRLRQFPAIIRLNICLNVIVGGDRDSNTVTEDYVSALSVNGIYISTLKPKPVGLEIPIMIYLEDTKIPVERMVLYSFERGKGPLKTPGMGIKFVRIKPEDQRIIKSFIGRQITKGLTMAHIGMNSRK